MNKTEKALLKIIKKFNRERIGFLPTKIYRNKKKYKREKYRYKNDN